jgi:hypothetical protein
LIGLSGQALGQTLGKDDIALMVKTSQSNDLRFKRDYTGKPFSTILPMRVISENPFSRGNYRITFGEATFFGNVNCEVSDKVDLDQMVEWNRGDLIEVSGTVKGTLAGDLQLDACKYRKQ